MIFKISSLPLHNQISPIIRSSMPLFLLHPYLSANKLSLNVGFSHSFTQEIQYRISYEIHSYSNTIFLYYQKEVKSWYRHPYILSTLSGFTQHYFFLSLFSHNYSEFLLWFDAFLHLLCLLFIEEEISVIFFQTFQQKHAP